MEDGNLGENNPWFTKSLIATLYIFHTHFQRPHYTHPLHSFFSYLLKVSICIVFFFLAFSLSFSFFISNLLCIFLFLHLLSFIQFLYIFFSPIFLPLFIVQFLMLKCQGFGFFSLIFIHN